MVGHHQDARGAGEDPAVLRVTHRDDGALLRPEQRCERVGQPRRETCRPGACPGRVEIAATLGPGTHRFDECGRSGLHRRLDLAAARDPPVRRVQRRRDRPRPTCASRAAPPRPPSGSGSGSGWTTPWWPRRGLMRGVPPPRLSLRWPRTRSCRSRSSTQRAPRSPAQRTWRRVSSTPARRVGVAQRSAPWATRR